MPEDQQPIDRPVTFSQVRVIAGPIATYLEYVRWLATNDQVRGRGITVEQIWTFYDRFIRDGADPDDAAKELGLPTSPDW